VGVGRFFFSFSKGMKWPGCEADHSPQNSVDIKDGGAISPIFQCPHSIVLN
jgi:hypothetical protein